MKKIKDISSSADLLQTVEVTKMFATGGTGICTCCIVQANT
jgi:hypothetical protein